MEERYCQSCGMPLQNPADYGTEGDGSQSADYCSYCYEKGAFTQNCTMEEMVELCLAPMVEAGSCQNEAEARAKMLQWFPTLKRWKSA